MMRPVSNFSRRRAIVVPQSKAIRFLSEGAGEALTTDTAWVGPADAKKGFGHHIRNAWNRRVFWICNAGRMASPCKSGQASQDIAALHIHAINPHGFAWMRRTNEDNIDINRNWLNFAAPLPDNSGYNEIAGDLCPADWSVIPATNMATPGDLDRPPSLRPLRKR